jgi:hypothetical protein
MKNQPFSPDNDKPVSQNQGEQIPDHSKEPSVLDKLKDQIKKLKEIKEKGTGMDDHPE